MQLKHYFLDRPYYKLDYILEQPTLLTQTNYTSTVVENRSRSEMVLLTHITLQTKRGQDGTLLFSVFTLWPFLEFRYLTENVWKLSGMFINNSYSSGFSNFFAFLVSSLMKIFTLAPTYLQPLSENSLTSSGKNRIFSMISL